MVTLVKLEIYKLVRKQSFWIGLLIMLAFFAETYLSWLNPTRSLLAKDGALLTGRAAVRQDIEISEAYQGIMTDDVVEQILCNERYNEAQIEESWILYNSEKSTDVSAVNRLVGYYFLRKDITEGEDAWGYRYGEEELYKIEDVFPESALPLYYEYSGPWGGTLESIISCIFLLNVFLIIGISPIFSEERTQKMNQLLFTSRFGRRKCFWAKAGTAYVLSSALAFGVILLMLLITVSIYGTTGLACSIQLVEPFLYQDYQFVRTLGAVIVDAVILSVAGIWFTVSLILLVSVLAKNALNTVVLSFVLFVVPVIVRIFPLADQVKLIAPINHMTDFSGVLCLPDMQIGETGIPYSYVIAGFLLLISVALTAGTAVIYEKQSDE
ncbi:MAG: hypothetical protein HDQ98_08215 [Lachnospiraceae bacterium]|nr:hypothetical protein [Lachnospiraceae bacterium]